MMKLTTILAIMAVLAVRGEDEDFAEFTPEEVSEIFAKYDANKDGLLDKAEFSTWLEMDVQEKMDSMDAETKEELSRLEPDDFSESATEFIHQGDTDKDGGLSETEFLTVMSIDLDDGGYGEDAGYGETDNEEI
eukprot:TRINITY_DN3906_c0_g1_i1.p1 TRINITY_DN3906_c0_g1~~TRINITY_DN3906_c0_g1_i1.p1  ORF type:complete len:134 (+),score=44.10 TRINITY_DN3906_c0_g1_i1:46-447(+)